MYSSALAHTGTAETAWAKAQAGRDLRDAVDALDDAHSSLATLAADSEWCSEGVRALREAIAAFRRRMSVDGHEARSREQELARIDVL